MRVTRRFWEVVGLGGVLSALAIVLGRPSYLVGAGALLGLLLVRQYVFVMHAAAAADSLTVSQTIPREHVLVDEQFPVTLRVSADDPLPLDIDVRANPPLAASTATGNTTLRLERGETTATETFQTVMTTVGVGSFDEPTVEFRSVDGFFEETVSLGAAVSITGEPRTPRRLHVGRGGEQTATGFGEHASGRRGPGLELAEIRRYVHGDDVRRIDWKATARLDEPHIRESHVSTVYQTALVVDHRRQTAVGTAGRTKLDYLREVAVAFIDNAETFGDPVGLYGVGDGGTTCAFPPRSSRGHYRSIRTALHDLRPTPSTGSEAESRDESLALSRHAAGSMVTDGSRYSETLEPYFRATERYAERFEGRPLYSTVRRRLTRTRGTACTVILTDDTNRNELYEAIKAADRKEGRVLVFLTPSVLFRGDPPTEFENEYLEYRDFERFRRRLDRLNGVSAFEVGHEDRLRALRNSGPTEARP